MAVGRWQLEVAGGSWQVAVGRWQSVGAADLVIRGRKIVAGRREGEEEKDVEYSMDCFKTF